MPAPCSQRRFVCATVSERTRFDDPGIHLPRHVARTELPGRARDLFSFDGRIGRPSYWLRALLLWGVNIVAIILFAVGGDAGAATIPMLLAGIVLYVAAFMGSLATTVKRLHDRGRSGWFMLIALIPLVGFWLLIEVGFLSGEAGKNEYGSPVA